MTITAFFDRLLTIRAAPRENTVLIRESHFKRDTALADLLSDLHTEKFTGQVTIDMSQGSIQGVRVREEIRYTYTPADFS